MKLIIFIKKFLNLEKFFPVSNNYCEPMLAKIYIQKLDILIKQIKKTCLN